MEKKLDQFWEETRYEIFTTFSSRSSFRVHFLKIALINCDCLWASLESFPQQVTIRQNGYANALKIGMKKIAVLFPSRRKKVHYGKSEKRLTPMIGGSLGLCGHIVLEPSQRAGEGEGTKEGRGP